MTLLSGLKTDLDNELKSYMGINIVLVRIILHKAMFLRNSIRKTNCAH